MLIVVVVSWIAGVAMGYSSAQEQSNHKELLRHVIVLNHIESGESKYASNWIESFIVHADHEQKVKPSWWRNLRSFFSQQRNHPEYISNKVDQVIQGYSPNPLDLKSKIQAALGSDVKVEIEINE